VIVAVCCATSSASTVRNRGCFFTRDTVSGGSSLYLIGVSGSSFMRVVRAQLV
jgi:hypothetical protein